MARWQDKDGVWHIEVHTNGKRIHRRCPKGTKEAQAKALEAKLNSDKWLGKLGKTPEITVAQALEIHLADMKSKRSYDTAKHHAYRLGTLDTQRSISEAPNLAAEAISQFKDEGYAIATINRSLAALKRGCSLAFKRGIVEIDYGARIELLPERNARHFYLSKKEIEKICKQDEGIADYVLISAYTGMRLGELLSLTQVNVVGDSLRLATSKNKKPRSVPIHATIADAVLRLPVTIPRRTLQQRFKSAVQSIGRPEITWHDLRHTTASLLINAGVDLYTVGQILGHSATQTTARYAHLVEETKRKAINSI